ncbi:aureocin A53 family class IId bacteriocin [Bacillus altitudinis]|uniref:aureocin A53 family class IId bacteriocin n=1 Tax=Bacillus altitudinis TaxID=293387 RepID=UPI00339B290B
MVAFLRLVAQLGTKAAKWAWDNKSTVMQRSNGSVIKLTALSMANSEFFKSGILEVKRIW